MGDPVPPADSSPYTPSTPVSETLAIIGCGNMGQSLLSGLLAATSPPPDEDNEKLTHFIVTTRRRETAEKLRQLHNEDRHRLTIYTSENNLPAIRESGTVILACRPGDLDGILNTEGLRVELSKKLVISVLQTRTPQEIVDALNDRVQVNGQATNLVPTVVRALPNLAAGWRLSMTIIENPEPLPEERLAMVTWIFEQIGAVKFLFGDAFYAGAMLAGAGPAVMSIALSGMFDGCVEAGLTQAETIAIGHRMLLGLAAPMGRQHHLLQMRESAATCPKGPIIKTLNQIEKHGVRGLLADAMVEGISCFARESPSGVTRQGPRSTQSRFILSVN